ncbi:hypothetical protein J4E86_006003 [Alternaria arbusti]|uniref:uncharacterized protein n=1 Tax=Alternaria arbusti TaxID=232088 RepID=UPI0022202677|nr:uncharacterized protein J4E86_006003 [Alternaria arbusti]KAI4954693.1 hypothetical protein J4E86_006003 [Alternaria arbusti]
MAEQEQPPGPPIYMPQGPKLSCLAFLKKYIDKSLGRVAERRERDESAIDLAQLDVGAMEEGEERKRAVEQLVDKMEKRMFESFVDAAMHDALQILTGAVETIVRNHVPNENDASQS